MREVRRGRARDPRLSAQARVMLVHGRCHCGNISFSLTWEPDPAEIPARACSCSFCLKHGGVWTSNPRGALEVVIFTRWSASTRSKMWINRSFAVHRRASMAKGQSLALREGSATGSRMSSTSKYECCSQAAAGALARIAYTADYYFFTAK